MGAVGIFAGARLPLLQAFAVPLGIMALTDTVLWLAKDWRPFDPFVYGSYAVCVLLGRTLTRSESPWRIMGTALLASVIFFLATNFGAWLEYKHLYARSLEGLMTSYVAGIPFYRGTFFGDLIYTAVLFGGYAWLTRRYFVSERVLVPSLVDSPGIDAPTLGESEAREVVSNHP
jgi:hypothetical protein